MTESRIEVVERIYDSWRRMEGMPEDLMDPEIEWVNPPDAVEPGTRHGSESFRHAISKVGGAWREVEIDVSRLEEVGDKVVAIVGLTFVGRESGVEVASRQGHVFTIPEGKVTRFEFFNQPERALAAVGLGAD